MNDIKNHIKKNIIKSFISIIFIIIFVVAMIGIMKHYDILQKPYYTANDFDIKTIYSVIDYNDNKLDDYTDFVLGARKDAENKPIYIEKEYLNAYPPDNEGINTDIIWRAFKNAGYNLKEMIDNDIINYPNAYPHIKTQNPNIDFRNIKNLKIFFNRYAITLTIDIDEISKWQPGDIVIFEDKHIGIISDKRNIEGLPFVIHNKGQDEREEDFLSKMNVTAHYRFDASKVKEEVLKRWQ